MMAKSVNYAEDSGLSKNRDYFASPPVRTDMKAQKKQHLLQTPDVIPSSAYPLEVKPDLFSNQASFHISKDQNKIILPPIKDI